MAGTIRARMPRHGDEDAHGTGRRTLSDADIEVVKLQPRIGRRSRASHSPPTIYHPSDGRDFFDRRPPPPVDLDDCDVDTDGFDGDIMSNP